MAILPPAYSARAPPSNPGRSKTVKTSSSRSRSFPFASRSRSEAPPPVKKHWFTFSSLLAASQPELSKKLFNLVKCENYAIRAHEAAGQERQSIASQLKIWGENTGDDAVEKLSDKLGDVMIQFGQEEEKFAQNLEDNYRKVMKQIRNTESGVQPTRDRKLKIEDEINKLKYKDPSSTKIGMLEQELVRAEAENLVAEAQLTNITRAGLKAAFDGHFAAVIERAEKQILMAKHGRRLLNLLDDTPIVPGEEAPDFDGISDARQIMLDLETDLNEYHLEVEEVESNAHAVPGGVIDGKAAATHTTGSTVGSPTPELALHPALRKTGSQAAFRKVSSGSVASSSGDSGYRSIRPPYPLTEEEREREWAKQVGKGKAKAKAMDMDMVV